MGPCQQCRSTCSFINTRMRGEVKTTRIDNAQHSFVVKFIIDMILSN